MARRIAFITGSRADFGHLAGIIRSVRDDSDCELQLIVTGSHLSPLHGLTVHEIEAEGLPIAARIEMQLGSDSGAATAKSMGIAMLGLADAFSRLSPDVVVILGDRFEMLAAASAALVMRIPIAHIHGGEATEGLVDESIRHAITKMSHLHFAAAEAYRDRIVQLGEEPERVFNFGPPGLDQLRHMSFLSREELERQLSMRLRRPLLLATFHPVTLDADDGIAAMQELTEALSAFTQGSIVVTGVNADTANTRITRIWSRFAATHKDACVTVGSLGYSRYVSLMKLADAVVGNSSSGLIEAPALRIPSVDIGVRQQGRLRAESVIHCAGSAEDIRAAIARATDPSFRRHCDSLPDPLDGPAAAPRIKNVLKNTALSSAGIKKFYSRP